MAESESLSEGQDSNCVLQARKPSDRSFVKLDNARMIHLRVFTHPDIVRHLFHRDVMGVQR